MRSIFLWLFVPLARRLSDFFLRVSTPDTGATLIVRGRVIGLYDTIDEAMVVGRKMSHGEFFTVYSRQSEDYFRRNCDTIDYPDLYNMDKEKRRRLMTIPPCTEVNDMIRRASEM